jgi:hypothetical protein
MAVRKVGITHDDAPGMWGASDFLAPESKFITFAPEGYKVTAKKQRLFDRGKDLLSTFVNNMTLRGRPESRESEEERQTHAQDRLTEAAHELLHDDIPAPISAVNLCSALAGISTRAVYLMMDRAGWEIDDVRKAANSLHMGCRNAG